MNRKEKLFKYELELAMPMIISGIRTSAVMIIGTATLAALIGAGGLGSFILLGIDRNDTALILIGAISSAILAIVFNYAIKFLEKKSLKTIIASLILAIILLIFSMIPINRDSNKLIIGGKLGVEPDILINMYKLLIEDQTDIEVELKSNFGKTSFLYEALKAGEIDIYPEFTGTVIGSLLEDPPNVSNDSEEVYQVARDEILNQDNLALLEPMLYQNTYAIAVSKAYAQEHDLKTISDLHKIEDEAVAGFTLEFNDREDGNRGLQRVYGLNLEVKTMEPALRYTAIENKDVQIIDAYSTDSQILRYDLVILEDDRHLFPPYQGAPLMRKQTLDEFPEIEIALNKLSGKITEEQMTAMNYDVDVNGRSAEDVALEYLIENGYLENTR